MCFGFLQFWFPCYTCMEKLVGNVLIYLRQQCFVWSLAEKWGRKVQLWFSIGLHFSDQSCFNSNSVYYNLPYTLIFFISFKSSRSTISWEVTFTGKSAFSQINFSRKSQFSRRHQWNPKIHEIQQSVKSNNPWNPEIQMSHFRSHIFQEIYVPKESHFLGSHIFWEVKLPGKSNFPGSHIYREVTFYNKLTSLFYQFFGWFWWKLSTYRPASYRRR